MENVSDASAWTKGIPDDEWVVYERVIHALNEARIPFAIGGAFALAAYIGRWRNTKDLDFYVLPKDIEKVKTLLAGCELSDYYPVLPYQRHWIYRAHSGGIIVDAIWAMANWRADVDSIWLTEGVTVQVRDMEVPVIAAEELLWAKLYILQRDRCDWPDVWNLLGAVGPQLDWDRLFHRLSGDTALLQGAIAVFSWIAPERARALPPTVFQRLGLPRPEKVSADEVSKNVSFIDTRQWFFTGEGRVR
jgi:hypothetical protein